jgi:hypothetical protein
MEKRVSLFKRKNEIINNDELKRFKEVDLEEFVRVIFMRNNVLSFQEKGNYEPLKYNAICVEINGEDSKSWILTKDLEILDELVNKEFVIISPITYIGRNRTSKNARFCYGLAFDIDGVDEKHMVDILYQMRTGHIPEANLIVNSGNGIHLYYLFKEPIALFDNIKILLKDFKYSLTERLWNAYTSKLKEKQFQGIFQGFRIPGTKTKFNETVTVFENIEKEYYNISELNEYVFPEYKLSDNQIDMINNAKYDDKRITLNQAKEKYPDWYERRIIKGEKRGKWNIKRDLYDWWVRKLNTNEVKEGHRYFCLMSLAMYAIKCNIKYEELKKDAYNFLKPFENMTKTEDNHFTAEDIEDSLKAFLENYSTFPRKDIEKLTGIRIDPNKRNGRKRKEHIKIMNFIREEINQNKNWNKIGNGRKKGSGEKKEIVKSWKLKNPGKRKIDCYNETKISRPTIDKWWDRE